MGGGEGEEVGVVTTTVRIYVLIQLLQRQLYTYYLPSLRYWVNLLANIQRVICCVSHCTCMQQRAFVPYADIEDSNKHMY